MKKMDMKIVITSMLILLVLIVGLSVYELSSSWAYGFQEWFDSTIFIVWFNSLNGRVGSIALLITPLVLIYGTCYSFYKKYQSGIFKEIVIRQGYEKTVRKELISGYLRGFILPVTMLIIFMIIMVSGPGLTLDKVENSYFLLSPPWGNDVINNFKMVAFVLMSQWLFTIFLVNVTYSLIPFLKKFYLVMISGFICVNVFNYAISIISPLIKKSIGVYPENVYETMMSDSVLRTLITLGICLIVSNIMVYLVYRKQDRVVLNHD